MKKPLRILSVVLIIAAQFACAGQAEFDRNRKLWQDSGVKNYKMTVEIQKPGHATPNGKFVITVRNGKAESTQFAASLTPVPDTVRFGSYKTIDDVFGYAEDLEKSGGGWNRKVIEYDPKLGYPTRVDLDKAGSLDEELSFKVLQFEIIE